jgi:hypothetical protein
VPGEGVNFFNSFGFLKFIVAVGQALKYAVERYS